MQVLTFPQPETVVQQQVIDLLEGALAAAKEGNITSVIVVSLDDRGEDDAVGVMAATDGWTQTAGMLMAAQKAL